MLVILVMLEVPALEDLLDGLEALAIKVVLVQDTAVALALEVVKVILVVKAFQDLQEVLVSLVAQAIKVVQVSVIKVARDSLVVAVILDMPVL